MNFRIVSTMLCLNFLLSCSLLDNDEPVPFFLDLNTPTVRLPFENGFDTHKITDIWVFADGQILGVYPLPARVPVFYQSDTTTITILAGIRNNGMQSDPVFYPFYNSIDVTIYPKPNQSINIPLNFSYLSNAKIPINVGFEDRSCFTIDLDGKAEPVIEINSIESAVGLKSGKVILTNTNKFLEVACDSKIKSGDNARGKSYLELDYKGQGEIAVGIIKSFIGTSKIEYVLYIPGKENWNKIYVDLTDKLSANDYIDYSIVLLVSKTGQNVESVMYLDNIKHLHF